MTVWKHGARLGKMGLLCMAGLKTSTRWAIWVLAWVPLVGGLVAQAAPKTYDPDPMACQMEVIRGTFRSNLLPWNDQPAEVQQRLWQLQAAMTRDTLRECQAKGLLSPEEGNTLIKELGLQESTSPSK